jgi:hypothetical protein
MKNLLAFVSALALLVCSVNNCHAPPAVTPDAGQPAVDAGLGATGGASGASGAGAGGLAGTGGATPTDSCSRAEAYAAAKGCVLKHPKAATWAAACQNGKANGLDMQDDCILKQTTCPAILACTSKAPPN